MLSLSLLCVYVYIHIYILIHPAILSLVVALIDICWGIKLDTTLSFSLVAVNRLIAKLIRSVSLLTAVHTCGNTSIG